MFIDVIAVIWKSSLLPFAVYLSFKFLKHVFNNYYSKTHIIHIKILSASPSLFNYFINFPFHFKSKYLTDKSNHMKVFCMQPHSPQTYRKPKFPNLTTPQWNTLLQTCKLWLELSSNQAKSSWIPRSCLIYETPLAVHSRMIKKYILYAYS